MAAAAVRSTGEASPSCEDSQWQLAHRKRRSSASQGSPGAEESGGQSSGSKRHSPLRESGSLSWSIDSPQAGELPSVQAQLAASSNRGVSSRGSPGLSVHGWPVSSSASEEGTPSGAALAAAAGQLSAGASPMPSGVQSGHASVQLPPVLSAQLQTAGVPNEWPAVQLQSPGVACTRLLPQPHSAAAGAAAGSAASELPPLLALPLPLAEQLARQVPSMQHSMPAPQHTPQHAALAALDSFLEELGLDEFANLAADCPVDASHGKPTGVPAGVVCMLLHATEQLFMRCVFAKASDALEMSIPPAISFPCFPECPAALSPLALPPQQGANGLVPHSTAMSAAELEAAAAAAAASLGVDLNDSQLADLAALGLSPLLPCSPTAAVGGSVAAFGAPSSPAAATPAAPLPSLHSHSNPRLQEQLQVQQAQQRQQQQLHNLQRQVWQLQHAQPAAPVGGAASAASPPSPPVLATAAGYASPGAAAPLSSPGAAPIQVWPPPEVVPEVCSGTGGCWVEVQRVGTRPV